VVIGTGLAAASAATGIVVGRNLLDEIGLRQLFIRDPNGLVIELNFREGRRNRIN
jgi:hypothetical protein